MKKNYIKIQLISVALSLSICACNMRKSDVIDLQNVSGKGLIKFENVSYKPDEKGVFASVKVKLPEFIEGIYFGTDAVSWPAVANRIFQWKFKNNLSDIFNVEIESYRKAIDKGAFVMLHLKNGETLMLMSMLGNETMSWFRVLPDGELLIEFGNLGTDPFTGEIPLIAYAKADEFYQATAGAWSELSSYKDRKDNMKLREEKKYPEMFKYLGWCTWEQYKLDISEKSVLEAINNIKKIPIPIRWILIDDGHLSVDPELTFNNENNKVMGLKSFEPNNKFPDGWKNIIAQKDDKIKWMGLWYCMNGYWGGIAVNNAFSDKMNSHFMVLKRGEYSFKMPKIDPTSSKFYYDALMDFYKSSGFDLAKIDVQSENVARYNGTTNAIKAANINQHALENAVNSTSRTLINCMAHQLTNFYNSKYSIVGRVSKDYAMNKPATVKSQIFQSFHNVMWLGQTMWGDHDMFHSSDKGSGKILALCKAMSGGPVYLSDAPSDFIDEYIMPLCYKDGELLRPAAPATSLPNSSYIDPVNEQKPYSAIAPYSNGVATILLNNIYKDSVDITATINLSDYTHASCMIQPYPGKWAIPQEGIVAYDWESKEISMLKSSLGYKLSGLSNKIVHLYPVIKGWAIIGLTQKYLSPASIVESKMEEGKVIFTLKESGEFAIYLKVGTPTSTSTRFVSKGNGLWIGNTVKDMDKIVVVKK